VKKIRFAQLAMALDCEGSIGIRRSVQKHYVKTGLPIYSYTASFRIHNTDIRLLEFMKEHFGGAIHKGHSTWADNHGKTKWKTSSEWMHCLGSERGEKLILAVLPYLIIKKEQAKLALEFIRIGRVPKPEERERIWLQMKQLNVRGLTPTTNTPDATQAA
jgi:hypothetical protein